MNDVNDLEHEYFSFQKTAVAVSALLSQIPTALVAVLLCSAWWHYVLLVLLSLALTPLWVGFFTAAMGGWWDRHAGSARETEDIEEELDVLDQSLPSKFGVSRSWPFPQKKA